jgi:hypothetical protein
MLHVLGVEAGFKRLSADSFNPENWDLERVLVAVGWRVLRPSLSISTEEDNISEGGIMRNTNNKNQWKTVETNGEMTPGLARV